MTDAGKAGVTVYTTPTDVNLVARRVLEAAPADVFDAWTNPALAPKWLLGPEGWTMPVCEIDLRVGGVWHYVWRNAGGNQMEMRGEYLEVAPPGRLVAT